MARNDLTLEQILEEIKDRQKKLEELSETIVGHLESIAAMVEALGKDETDD